MDRLKYTRAILDAIHSGELAKADYEVYDTFRLYVPTSCPGVPSSLLNPKKSWTGKADFQAEVTKLGVLFSKNFEKYAEQATPDVIAAGEFVKYIGRMLADVEIVYLIMAGPVIPSKNPQLLTNGMHEVRELENGALQTNGVHDVRQVENEAPHTNGVHEVREVEAEAAQTNEVPVESIETNRIHTDLSPETNHINGFHTSPPSSEPEANGFYTSATIQTNGTHPEFTQASGAHNPSDADANITVVSQEAPVVNGIHPLKAAKLEAAAALAGSNGVQVEPENVAKITVNKKRSDSGVGMTNETSAH